MYQPDKKHVQEIRVDARVHNQQVVTIFHLKSTDYTATSDGNSATLLNAFRGAYLAWLGIMSDSYEVYAYVMTEIVGTVFRGPVDKPHIYVKYKPNKREVLLGIAGDVGQVPTVAMLPMHECMRIFKRPASLARGYFAGNAWRVCPFLEGDHSDTQSEQWNQALLDAWNPVLANFVTTNLSDGGVTLPNTWKNAVWSAAYFQNVIRGGTDGTPPAGDAEGHSHRAAQILAGAVVSPYVGTQVSRRFSPGGIPTGK